MKYCRPKVITEHPIAPVVNKKYRKYKEKQSCAKVCYIRYFWKYRRQVERLLMVHLSSVKVMDDNGKQDNQKVDLFLTVASSAALLLKLIVSS